MLGRFLPGDCWLMVKKTQTVLIAKQFLKTISAPHSPPPTPPPPPPPHHSHTPTHKRKKNANRVTGDKTRVYYLNLLGRLAMKYGPPKQLLLHMDFKHVRFLHDNASAYTSVIVTNCFQKQKVTVKHIFLTHQTLHLMTSSFFPKLETFLAGRRYRSIQVVGCYQYNLTWVPWRLPEVEICIFKSWGLLWGHEIKKFESTFIPCQNKQSFGTAFI